MSGERVAGSELTQVAVCCLRGISRWRLAEAEQGVSEQSVGVALEPVSLHKAVPPKRRYGTRRVMCPGDGPADRADHITIAAKIDRGEHRIAEVRRPVESRERRRKYARSALGS